MHRRELLGLLSRHQTRFIEESAHLDRARAFVDAHEDCFHCDLWPGHVTGSAWVVSSDRHQVLLMHHRKHDQWFQPGGHADGDADILRVALRETAEETGVEPSHIRLVSEAIFDLDIHVIPASPRGPRHEHFDVRFLVEMDDDMPIPGNDESHQVIWVPLMHVSRYNNNRSTYRMVEKTRRLRSVLEACA
ncbi:NUDIX hydrolase [Ectothiorhodospira marina]|uniref:ADP-ribose pyrophosphatase YjhB, NUDIX family n=1 Tax=Ectothiorhodospira marina TaxID=1396821 RepID=A0A1H7QU08_9GAMM|nr:NUDIX hydrolase [Ectothiorhodospira marina]SEL51446.1 ADP-ribose pyrophosphatase YjhB, NUDIX family [Ectothiorhodospira marina]